MIIVATNNLSKLNMSDIRVYDYNEKMFKIIEKTNAISCMLYTAEESLFKDYYCNEAYNSETDKSFNNEYKLATEFINNTQNYRTIDKFETANFILNKGETYNNLFKVDKEGGHNSIGLFFKNGKKILLDTTLPNILTIQGNTSGGKGTRKSRSIPRRGKQTRRILFSTA
jgi:hypothetical protein